MEDVDSSTSAELIGEVETTLASIMGKKAQTFEAELLHNNQKNRGNIIVRAESMKQSNKTVKMQFTWSNCGNVRKGCCGETVLRVHF